MFDFLLKMCLDFAAVRAVQIMEDASGDYEPGPIAWGDEAHGMTKDRVRAMMSNLVKLHAWGWGKDEALFSGQSCADPSSASIFY